MVRIGEQQQVQAPQQFSPAATQGLPAGDPRQQLVGRSLDDLAAKGTPERQLLGMIHQSLRATPGLSLRGLPAEVAQQILDSRAETMEQFFASWAESIQHNAEAEKAATERRLLSQVMQKAVNSGSISPSQAEACGAAAGVSTLEQGVSAAEAAARQQATQAAPRAPSPQDAMTPPGEQVGASLAPRR